MSTKRDPVGVHDMLLAVRSAYRIGVLDGLLRTATTFELRQAFTTERERRVEELRVAGFTEVVFEDVAA